MIRCERGASAAEFAIVLPLLILLLLGIIDAGRFMWTYNQAEKATQVGARMAAVTNALAPGLIEEDYAGKSYGGTVLKTGDFIPVEALGTILCNSNGCSCAAAPCPDPLGTMDSATFNAIVARMNLMYPDIAAENVEVRYSGSGLGAAGADPTGGGGGGAADSMEISPLITVNLRDVEFEPLSLLLAASVTMPDFRTTLTAEDASGVYSE